MSEEYKEFIAVPEETPGYHPTPESSPELTKRSWSVIIIIIIIVIIILILMNHIIVMVMFVRFGSLMSTEKDESYTVVVKGKALASIKVFDKKMPKDFYLKQILGRPHPRFPLCVGPPALGSLSGLLQAGVQERIHRPCHVPKTGFNHQYCSDNDPFW